MITAHELFSCLKPIIVRIIAIHIDTLTVFIENGPMYRAKKNVLPIYPKNVNKVKNIAKKLICFPNFNFKSTTPTSFLKSENSFYNYFNLISNLNPHKKRAHVICPLFIHYEVTSYLIAYNICFPSGMDP